mgnify:CR=1 FL=1
MFHCQGAGGAGGAERCGRSSPVSLRGAGCSCASRMLFVYNAPLLYIYNIYEMRFPAGRSPGRGHVSGPAPGAGPPETQKAVSSVIDTQHRLNHSERNTIGPIPLSPLQKQGRLGIIRLRCSHLDCCVEWFGHSSQARRVVPTPCGLPLFSVSGLILYHATEKIKWFPALAARYQPILRLQLQLHPCAGGVGGHLRHGDRLTTRE